MAVSHVTSFVKCSKRQLSAILREDFWVVGFGSFPKLGVLFGGPHSKDYSIWGSILSPPILGNYRLEFGFWVRLLGYSYNLDTAPT